VGEALAPELAAVRERLTYDTPYWARNCATILTDEKKPVRLNARPWQEDFDAALERQRAAGRPMRVVILKARKLGFSTWVQAKFTQRVTQIPFQRAITVAHLQKSAGELMDMASLMYERLPTDEQLAELLYGVGTREAAPFSVRPHLLGRGQTRTGARYMQLGDRRRPTEGSVIETMTAGAKGAGRGGTPSLWHGSEAAWWDDPTFITGALSALPLRPETIAVLESTANGFNHFFDTWQNAVSGAEDPEVGGLWIPLFYGWQDNPYNMLPFSSDLARDRFERTIGDADGGGDEEEVWLIEDLGVTLEQLHWRRTILSGPEMNRKLELFHQEHPATPEQAFIGSGTPVFAGILVSRALSAAGAADEPAQGLLRGDDWKVRETRAGTVRIPQKVLWVPEHDIGPEDLDVWGSDRLVVWEHPVNDETQKELAEADRAPDGQYVAFADIAQGKDTTRDERDWSAVQVLDHVSRMQVARWRTRLAIHDLPLPLFLIALYFNLAILAPEVTGLGIGPTDALAKDMRYPRLYRRRRAGDDQRTDQREQLLGWETTLRTKPLMEQTFGQALKEGTHGMRDVLTGREFTTYVETERGKHQAQKGAFDDLAMSYMGVHRVAAELRPRDPNRKRSGRGRSVVDPLTGY
jgi:hypothetical protein